MKLLAARLRLRRRQLRLHQKDVAKTGSSSLLSKVETGTSWPSLKTLREWASVLETTASDLLGDQLLLEAAKHTILTTNQCHFYLNLLPETETTRFLKELSSSASSLSTPVPTPPKDDSELQYLTAKVHLQKGAPKKAASLAHQALSKNTSPLWRIYHLTLLCQIYEQLSELKKRTKVKKELQATLEQQKIDLTLPLTAELSQADLDLLKLRNLLHQLRICLKP